MGALGKKERALRQKEYFRAWRLANPERAKAIQARYAKKHRDELREKSRRWSKANHGRYRDEKRRAHLRREFGLTIDQYEEMFTAQGGLCAICRHPETHRRKNERHNLAIDHCHATGRVRGLLCNSCNRAIGLLKDSIELAQAAAEYLRR